jgi:hypothetical protein
VPQPFNGVTTQPSAIPAQNAIDHSGRLRMAMAMRSPLAAP